MLLGAGCWVLGIWKKSTKIFKKY